MAEKDTLQVTKATKYIVNEGQPNEAIYDAVSDPTWVEDRAYYIASWHGKDGIIDQNGLIVFPFTYPKIHQIVIDQKCQKIFVIGGDGGLMFTTMEVALMDNPKLRSYPCEYIEPFKNKTGDLFFRTLSNCHEYKHGLMRFHADRNWFEKVLDEAVNEIQLCRAYNPVSLCVHYAGSNGSMPAIIDCNGAIIHEIRNNSAHSVEWLDRAENAFIVTHRSVWSNRYMDYTPKEILVVTEDHKILTEEVPRDMLLELSNHEKLLDFLEKEVEFYDQIVWGNL